MTLTGALALAGALTTAALLPRHAYIASAIVGIEGGQASLRPALAQAAADAAVSRQVMTRAAASRPAVGTPETLSHAVRAEIGRVPGTLAVRAEDADAEHAASMASAVATALVADLEDRAQDGRRAADATAALRLAKLQGAATTAHRRLADLGGDVVDPAVTGAAAAARVSALHARLDAIRAILAAGQPPLGAGRDVPPSIDALQTSYVDLTRQLATASETLGDKHTTVIGLRDGIKRTAAELTAAWTKLAKSTEADLAEAKSRAGTIRGGERDAGRLAEIDVARAAAQAADEAVTRAQGVANDDEIARYRVIAPAPVPALAQGLAPPLHLAAATLAGLAVLILSRLIFGGRTRRSAEPLGEPDLESVSPASAQWDALEPCVATRSVFFDDEAAAAEPAAAAAGSAAAPRPAAAPVSEPDLTNVSRERILHEALHARTAMSLRPPLEPRRASNYDLVVTMARVLPSIDSLGVRGEMPIVMVATNEPGTGTMDAVLALGEAAAAAGRRVLIVEGAKARPALAASVDEHAEPALIDVFGDLRVVLRAEAGEGLLYLAPSFRDGARLADDLARRDDTLVADALADEFDLVVIDGDRASEAYALAREADAFLRIGRFASPRDDEHFLALLGAPRHAFLGTVAADISVFVPSVARRATPAEVDPQRPTVAPLRGAPAVRPVPRAPFVSTRRPAGAEPRRRMGSR